MKKFLFSFLSFFFVYSSFSSNLLDYSLYIPKRVYLPQFDSSNKLVLPSSTRFVNSWDDVYSVFYNSPLCFTTSSASSYGISHPNQNLVSTNVATSASSDIDHFILCSSPQGSSVYLSPFCCPDLSKLYFSCVSLSRNGFQSSNIVNPGDNLKNFQFTPSLLFSEVLSSSTSEFRSNLLSSLSSISSYIPSISTVLDDVGFLVDDFQSLYRSVNSLALDDFSSISNSVLTLLEMAYIPKTLSDNLLTSIDTRYYNPSEIPDFDLYYKNRCRVVANTVASVVKLRGIGNVLGLDVPQNNVDVLNRLGGELTKRLSEDVTSKLDEIKNSLPDMVSGSNNSFQASLQGVFSNNWNLVTNDHNVVNQALQNITNFIQGADLGQIHGALTNIAVNTSPLPKVYNRDAKALQVYVVNPSSPAYPPGEDPSSQMLEAFGGWVGEAGTNTWNLFAGNLTADFEELLDLVRAFRYDFQDWTHGWDQYRDESFLHFDRHRSYISYITNFVSNVLDPTMVMLKSPLEDYTNVLSIAHSRLAVDYDTSNPSTLGLASSMLGHIPETDSLLHDVKELTNVVDFSSRSLIEDSFGYTNQFNNAVSLYYKNVSLPSNINLNIYRDISFSIPVSEQSSLWTLLRNGLGFGLFIVNVILFPKFLLHLLRLLFGAADSFYANQVKP